MIQILSGSQSLSSSPLVCLTEILCLESIQFGWSSTSFYNCPIQQESRHTGKPILFLVFKFQSGSTISSFLLFQKIALHLSYQCDDSYTPATLCIRAGTGLSDLQDVRLVTFQQPDGWLLFDVYMEPSEDGGV